MILLFEKDWFRYSVSTCSQSWKGGIPLEPLTFHLFGMGSSIAEKPEGSCCVARSRSLKLFVYLEALRTLGRR